MPLRSLLLGGLLLLSGCAYDAGYYESGSYGGYSETPSYYSGADYGSPYVQGPPVYGSPYAPGPVYGGVYYYGSDNRHRGWDDDDWHHGNGHNGNGHHHGGNQDGGWNNGGWNGGGQGGGGNNQGGWCKPGNPDCKHHHADNGNGHRPNNPDRPSQAWQNQPGVYTVPQNPDGRGTPTFLPNGCGRKHQPPCN